jgi:hypothetical protein
MDIQLITHHAPHSLGSIHDLGNGFGGFDLDPVFDGKISADITAEGAS